MIADTPTITPTKALWLVMLLSIITAPLGPDPRSLGFHSVEFSFFLFVGVFGLLTLLWILKKGIFRFSIDPIYYYFLAFLFISLLSMVDAPNKVRSAFMIGQYLPYFFLVAMCITILQHESQLDEVLNVLTHIALFYSIMVCGLSFIYNDRAALDDFLLKYFSQECTKILMYIELIFCLLAYQAFHGRLGIYRLFVLIMMVLAVLASGGRTNIGVMAVVFGLSFIKSKNDIKKYVIVFVLICSTVFMVLTVDYLKERLSLMVVTSARDYDEKITAFSRVYTTEIALQVIRTHPINGTGIGNLSYFTMSTLKGFRGLPPDILAYWEQRVRAGRNVSETTITPIKFAAEMGFLGFIFFFAFYWHLWKRVNGAINSASGSYRVTLLGMRMYVIGSFVHNLLDPGITNYYSWFYYGLVIAGSRIAFLPSGGQREMSGVYA